MTRLFLASIAVVSTFFLVLCAVGAQQPTPKKGTLPKPNQLYVKIILPAERPVVESWIAEQLKKRGYSEFTSATPWVPLDVKGEKETLVWDGGLDLREWGNPVDGLIAERADGRIKVLVGVWAADAREGLTLSLTDEPGSRAIAAVERAKIKGGVPYVAVLIGRPRETPVAPKKGVLPKLNQVYVKIILPDPPIRDKDRPVVESWVAEHLKKHGQPKFSAATAWVPIAFTGKKFEDSTLIWEGGCRVHGVITERKDGRTKVCLNGWGPGGGDVTVSLADEPGSREIATAEPGGNDEGFPYVAVLIGPPGERAAAPND